MSPMKQRLRAAKSVVELQKKVSKLYDDMTELTADLRVGEISVDEPKNLACYFWICSSTLARFMVGLSSFLERCSSRYAIPVLPRHAATLKTLYSTSKRLPLSQLVDSSETQFSSRVEDV